jgi:hypothetical protein
MTALALATGVLPPSTPGALDLVQAIEERVLRVQQTNIPTHHVLHAGVYTRTICIPAGVVLTGALIKIPTTLVICGRASVILGDGEEVMVEGYQVLAARAGRKQAFIAHGDTYVTMFFATSAVSVEAAENEFTDDAERLMSRTGQNVIVITGD